MSVIWVVIGVSVLLAVGVVVGRFLRLSSPLPCYRCGIVATDQFMSIPYCGMCRIVVSRMLPAVRHDPPFGFPGSDGYLEFPVEKVEKKEG